MEKLDFDSMFFVRDTGMRQHIADGKDTRFMFSNCKVNRVVDIYFVRYCVPYNLFLRSVYLFLRYFLRHAHPVFEKFNELNLKWVVRIPSCAYLSLPFDTRIAAVHHEVFFLLENDVREFKKGLKTLPSPELSKTLVDLFRDFYECGDLKKEGNVYFLPSDKEKAEAEADVQ